VLSGRKAQIGWSFAGFAGVFAASLCFWRPAPEPGVALTLVAEVFYLLALWVYRRKWGRLRLGAVLKIQGFHILAAQILILVPVYIFQVAGRYQADAGFRPEEYREQGASVLLAELWPAVMGILALPYLFRSAQAGFPWRPGDEAVTSKSFAVFLYFAGCWLWGMAIVAFLFPRGRPKKVLNYSARCFRRGRQHWAGIATGRIEHDARPPVLYLRSFAQDAIGLEAVGFGFSRRALFTEEEQLAMVLDDIGPFVAVGRPGQSLPESGALRVFLSNEEWRPAVRSLMQRARLVVLRPGPGTGILWEIETAFQMLQPDRLVVLTSGDVESYREFRERVKAGFGIELPDIEEPKDESAAGLSGIVSFRPGWGPEHCPFDRGPWSPLPAVTPLAPSLVRAFEPVANRLGVQIRRWGQGWAPRAIIVAAILTWLVFQFQLSLHDSPQAQNKALFYLAVVPIYRLFRWIWTGRMTSDLPDS